MNDSADSGRGERGGGRGLFGWIGRLFGGGSADDRPDEPARPEAAKAEADGEPGTVDTGRGASGPAPPGDAAAGDDEEEPLVLGPAYKAAPGEGGTSGRDEALTLTGAAGADTAADDELMLVASDPASDSDEEAKRPGEGEGEDAAPPEPGPVDEEALITRMRERLGEGAGQQDTGEKVTEESDTEENHGTPPEGDQAGPTGRSAAAPLPEEDGVFAPSRLSGEDRGDGEGTFPAGDAWPNGREPMEGDDMDGKDETETGDDTTTPEAEEPAAALFFGAARDAATPEAGADDAGAKDAGDAAATDELRGAGEDSAETADTTAERDPEAEAAGPETTDVGEPEPVEPEDTAGSGAAFGSRDSEEEGDDGPDAVLAAMPAGFGANAPAAPVEAPDGESAVVEETVRRLIREELEGELGERLSRNIRRMIREEVAHALLRNR